MTEHRTQDFWSQNWPWLWSLPVFPHWPCYPPRLPGLPALPTPAPEPATPTLSSHTSQRKDHTRTLASSQGIILPRSPLQQVQVLLLPYLILHHRKFHQSHHCSQAPNSADQSVQSSHHQHPQWRTINQGLIIQCTLPIQMSASCLHQETIFLLVADTPHHLIILGSCVCINTTFHEHWRKSRHGLRTTCPTVCNNPRHLFLPQPSKALRFT